eukprot:m.122383 g.122383  ORF g.122383 m.122383 type:complete len:325 (+) comp13418_c0_seq1:1375-2349(+)
MVPSSVATMTTGPHRPSAPIRSGGTAVDGGKAVHCASHTRVLTPPSAPFASILLARNAVRFRCLVLFPVFHSFIHSRVQCGGGGQGGRLWGRACVKRRHSAAHAVRAGAIRWHTPVRLSTPHLSSQSLVSQRSQLLHHPHGRLRRVFTVDGGDDGATRRGGCRGGHQRDLNGAPPPKTLPNSPVCHLGATRKPWRHMGPQPLPRDPVTSTLTGPRLPPLYPPTLCGLLAEMRPLVAWLICTHGADAILRSKIGRHGSAVEPCRVCAVPILRSTAVLPRSDSACSPFVYCRAALFLSLRHLPNIKGVTPICSRLGSGGDLGQTPV